LRPTALCLQAAEALVSILNYRGQCESSIVKQANTGHVNGLNQPDQSSRVWVVHHSWEETAWIQCSNPELQYNATTAVAAAA
jgi:hypothetical protein